LEPERHEVESQQYEFSSSQNELIKQLAEKMRFVAYFLIGVGVLVAISGVFTLTRGGFANTISGVVQVIVGIWTNKAASSFKLIVNTQGNDIENLMGALGELRKLYTLQYWLLIVTLIFVVLGLVLVIVAGAFR
jgi:hypothetical protein